MKYSRSNPRNIACCFTWNKIALPFVSTRFPNSIPQRPNAIRRIGFAVLVRLKKDESKQEKKTGRDYSRPAPFLPTGGILFGYSVMRRAPAPASSIWLLNSASISWTIYHVSFVPAVS